MAEDKPMNTMYGGKIKLDLDKLKNRSKSKTEEKTVEAMDEEPVKEQVPEPVVETQEEVVVEESAEEVADEPEISDLPELVDEEMEIDRWLNEEVDDQYILRYWEQYTRAIS